jgi:glycosyltransferase involved in cell wall biosynthesis
VYRDGVPGHGARAGRLLIVSDTLSGGTGGVVVRHAQWFSQRGWDVDVAAPEDEETALSVARHRPVPIPGSIRRAGDVRRAAAALRLVCQRCRPDVVHCHGARSFLITRLVRRRAPFVTLHSISAVSSDPPGYAALRRPALSALSLVAAGAFSARPDSPPGWRFLPHASDRLVHLSRLPAPAAPEPTFLWVGRLDEPKRPDLFVDAMAALARRRPRVRGLMAGSGPLRPVVAERIARRRAPVQLLGHVSELSPLLLQAWAVVLLSEAEAVNFALQEAMWAGRAVVGSPLAGIRWLLGPPGEGGTVVATMDDTVAALEALCDIDVARRAGALAADRIRSMLTPDDPWPTVERAYRSRARQRRRPSGPVNDGCAPAVSSSPPADGGR